MMRLAAVALLLAPVAALPQAETRYTAMFEEFKSTYAKDYASEAEHARRLGHFKANMAQSEEWNELKAYGEDSAVFGMTKFSDLSADEFESQYLNYRPSGQTLEALEVPEVDTAAVSKIDWYMNMTTPVKDQGTCGSCWAFSATEQIESMWIKKDAPPSPKVLSVQQIVSCDKNKDEGCQGGDTATAYKYVQRTGGLTAGGNYPYTSGKKGKTGKCERAKERDFKVSISKGVSVGRKQESVMKQYVASTGPLSICVDAAKHWQNYKKGLLGPKYCKKKIDHCVQVTGFDMSGDYPYWIVRNSWNTDWGIGGFIHLAYGEDSCGITAEPSTVVIAEVNGTSV